MRSVTCWSSDARSPSASPELRRAWGNCACIPGPCNNACRGTRPSHAAKCRALWNRPMSATVAAIRDAVIGPMPGTVARRRAVSSCRAWATIAASKSLLFLASTWRWSSNPRTACRAPFGTASSASTSAISSSSLSVPRGTMRPNSAARSRMALASIVCCLTNRERAECQARIPCCSRLLAGTNVTSGRDTASQSAAASAASFFLPRLTKGLTALGAISFTLCPSNRLG